MNHEATFRLANASIRQRAIWAVSKAPEGYMVEIREATRSKEQNAALHAALQDIAEQLPWHGRKLSVDVWKRLCTASWLREEGEQPELIPALDGHGFDIIFEHTSKMTVKQLSSLLDWCLMFGAQNGVTFKAPR